LKTTFGTGMKLGAMLQWQVLKMELEMVLLL